MRITVGLLMALWLLLAGEIPWAVAGGVSVEQSLRRTSEQILALTDRVVSDRASQLAPADRVSLAELQTTLQAGHLLLAERFRQREGALQGLAGEQAGRHRLAVERYTAVMTDLLANLQQISTQISIDQGSLTELRTLLKQLSPPQFRPIHGLMPYGTPDFPPVLPATTSQLTPAYRLATVPSATAPDLAGTPEAPISPFIVQQAQAIAAQAGRIHWDPAAIYNWVRTNIRTEWYWGCMKGAEETLRQGGGNAADQAALLIALLRASGYPARYVRGVIEFFPGLDAAKAMTGIADSAQLLEFFRSAGIPCEPVYQGEQIANIRIEHLWVETLVPYANYRGLLADSSGQLWVPLDTSIKTGAAIQAVALDLPALENNPVPGFRDRYLAGPREQSPLEMLAQEVEQFLAETHPGATFAETLHTRSQPQPSLEILPGTLQFIDIAVTAEYAALPAELVHQVRLTASVAEQILFDQTLPLHRLSNRKIMIGFEPETVADQEQINRWGGLDNTPAYLIRLRPTLLVDAERLVIGRGGLAPGEAFTLTAQFSAPSGNIASSDRVQTGYPLLLGIVAGKALPPARETLKARADDWLHRGVLAYIASWERDEELLADLFDITLARPLPAYAVVGGILRTEALASVPFAAEWEGLFIDANLRRVVASPRQEVNQARAKEFMQLSALAGSVYEHQLFAKEFGVTGISTALLLALAKEGGLPLLTLDAGSAVELLPTLMLDAEVLDDVTTALHEGLTVHLPAASVSYQAWRGIGYLKENLLTGAAGYMLSGGLAGGQTVLGRRDWPVELAAVLAEPFTGPPNVDPTQAFTLTGVTPSQVSLATAGEELPASLMTLVRDAGGVPVAGALVTYTVRSGGGWLIDEQQLPAARVPELTVASDRDGIARARFVPGEQTAVNPVVYVREGDRHANLVGENLLDARLLSGSLAQLSTPLAIFGFAGLPDPLLSKAYGNNLHGEVFSYSGDTLLLLKDRFGNPVANYPVAFNAGAVQPLVTSLCQDPPGLSADQRDARLLGDDPCRLRTPVYGECAATAAVSVVSRSDGGALSGVVLGGIPYAAYPVTATFTASTGSRDITWSHHSNPFASCSAVAAPESRLVLTYQQRLNEAGRNVDARPADQSAMVQVKSYLLAEEPVVAKGGETRTCTPLPSVTCDLVAGNGAFDLAAPDQVVIAARPAVRAATLPGSQELPWLYQGDFTFPVGLVDIPIAATAIRTLPQIANSCTGCGELESAVTVNIGPVQRTLPIWGVAIQVPAAVTVLVDGQGVAQRDLRVGYTIEPADYVANQAQVLLYRNGELWDTLPSGTAGSATVTFPAGYWFDPQANYELQVLLNNAGEVNAIWSRKIPLLQRTAAVDLRVDGLPDAIEERVGAFVLINNDADEREHDPEVILPDAATPAILTTDDELKRAWLQIDDSSGAGGYWQIRASAPAKLRIYHLKDNLWVEFRPDDPPEPVSGFPAIIPLYLEGLVESAAIQGDSLTATFFPAGGASVADSVPATVVEIDMAVDGNRDRLVDFQNGQDEQALFWVNNDHDYLHEEDDLPVEDDADSGDDSIDATIACKRDLEDFTRLHVRLGASALPGPLTYTIQVLAADDKVQPMLNLFPAINLSDGYLGLPSDQATAEQPDEQLTKRLLVTAGKLPATLPIGSMPLLGENPFLFEGRMPGKGQLLLTASYQGLPVASRGVALELVDPTWFYDHFVVSQISEEDDSPVQPAVNPEGLAANASRLGLHQPTTSEYVLFVHGWNLQGWEKRRWTETIFKRLWWQGYQGKVGLFDWPCRTLPSWDFLVNYDRSEFIAWQSATALKGVLERLQGEHAGQVRILAHSQGNVVAGEALRSAESKLVHTYVASQAALSAGFFDKVFQPIQELTPKTPDVMSAYPADPEKRPYFYHVSSNTLKFINYFNQGDYALSGDSVAQPTWLLNNRTRPDGSLGYGYQGDVANYPPTPPALGFYRNVNWEEDEKTPVPSLLSFPGHRYEIYSFCAQSRSVALGASNLLSPTMSGAVNLSSFGYDRERFSHSRQFRSNVVAEQKYWRQFVLDAATSRYPEGI